MFLTCLTHKISIYSFLLIIQISEYTIRPNSTYLTFTTTLNRFFFFFLNKILLLCICFKISNSCSSTYSWPSNSSKINAFVISDRKHNSWEKVGAPIEAVHYFSPHSSIIHFQLYSWLPSRLFFDSNSRSRLAYCSKFCLSMTLCVQFHK